jgi:hypothetical protein
MWLGTYNIPEVRLYPDILNDVKRFSLIKPRIHDVDVDLDPKVLAKTLGLTPNSGAFYRRLNSSICYGLVEGRSRFRLTQLGEDITNPKNYNIRTKRQSLYKQSILSVPLWVELYKRFGKEVPQNLTPTLKDVTGEKLSLVQRMEKDIRRWYLKDLESISRENETDFLEDQIYSSSNSFGRVTVFDIGSIDIVDEKTLAIAESFFDIIKSRVTSSSSDIKSVSTKSIK